MWTKSPEQDFSQDNRGWPKGKRRKWDKETEQRVVGIYQSLVDDATQFYHGATAISMEWRKQYPGIPSPPLRTIGRILFDLGLSKKRKRDRHKGAARYLCYPEHTIYETLGKRLLEADFIGKKYLKGHTKPLNFIAFSFKKEPKLRYFKRIEGQTADNFIKQCGHFFKKFEKPDLVKVDNALTMIGSASGKRNVSRAMEFLLRHQVIPIFAVPRKPFSQASIEGNNSVFARNFWNRIEFKSIQEVDEKLEWFNQSSFRYTGYQPPKGTIIKEGSFIPKIYFIRQVREDKDRTGRGFIDILNEEIFLPEPYISYFVLGEWNLNEELLYIHFEKEQKLELVKKQSFKINKRSKKRISDFI